MTIGEFFGTLQDSITKEWREHLKTDKYSNHMCLNDFYEEMPEKIDALYQSAKRITSIRRNSILRKLEERL